ncbi:MAG: caspase family protein [Methylocystis sp.]
MRSRLVLALLAAVIACIAHAATAAERRIALVIGESAYEGKPIETAANDAGLIAQTLQAAGFDVSGARDLDEDSLRGSLRDFLEKARNVGPDGVAFIYFAGAGAQLEGDNYLLPVGAPITRDADISLHGVRLSDYMKPLASMGLKTAVIVLDAARALPFSLQGQPLAGGLALYDPGPSLLLAFNAAPGTIAVQEPGPYGVYAQALAEMIRAGGLPVAQVFDQTRLRVVERTNGAQIPWNSQGFDTPFIFFERTAQAPSRGVDEAALRSKPIAQFAAQDAFAAAIARDTLQSYQEFLVAYPDDPLAHRVRAILAARREALFWRKARMLNTPASYWTYLNRYPHGPHAFDARRLLAILASPPEPPPAFAPIDIGYPPPPPPEIVFVSRPVVFFGDPAWNFAPPPPPPPFFLPPPPPDFVVLPPPVFVGFGPYGLPVPPFVPVPVYVQPPAFVAAPPGNVYFANLHNSVVVDVNQNVVIANPQGHVLSTAPIAAGAVAGAAGAAIGATLPRYIANKAAVQPGAAVPPVQGVQRTVPGAPLQGQPPQGQVAPQQGQAQPAQGHGLPAQAPASGAQQPLQGSHALPQPNGNVLQGQGAAAHDQVPQTQGQAPQNQGEHGQGQRVQGQGLQTQTPASESAATPSQGERHGNANQDGRGRGAHDQGETQQPNAAAPKTQLESQPAAAQGAKAHGHQDHGHGSQTQAQPSPATPKTQPENQPAQAHGHQDHGHASQTQAPHGPAAAPQPASQQSHSHGGPPNPAQNTQKPAGPGPQSTAPKPGPHLQAQAPKPAASGKSQQHDHHDHH